MCCMYANPTLNVLTETGPVSTKLYDYKSMYISVSSIESLVP